MVRSTAVVVIGKGVRCSRDLRLLPASLGMEYGTIACIQQY